MSGFLEYYDYRNKVLSSAMRNIHIKEFRARKLTEKMEVFEIKGSDEQLTVKEKIEDLVAKLQMLKSKVSELRLQCEDIKKLYSSEVEGNALLCDECGKTIERGQEVIVRDPSGREKRHYHKECFKALWL